MSSVLSASMAEVAAMSESAFRKRFRSSYESSLSSSPPDLPLWKRYRGTSELVDDSEEDEVEEIEESLDSDSVSEDAENEGPTAEDEDPAVGDEGLVAGSRASSDGLGLEEEEEAIPGGQQQAAPVVGTSVSAPLGRGSGSAPESERPERVSASRQPTLTTWTDPENGMVYINVPAYPPPVPLVQTPPSPVWMFVSLPIYSSSSIVPSPVSSPMIPLTVPSPVATPATAETEGFLTELGAQVEMQGGLIREHAARLEELSPALFERYDRDVGELFTRSRAVKDEIFSQRYRFRSQTDAQRSALWHAIKDTQGENRDLRLQLAKEKRARLELAKIIDSMRRG
ncbi:hypothetical protein Tco_0453479 [Tanacetum coccineum]